MSTRLSEAIKNEAQRIGASPLDLATVMSYETGGTFDLWQEGPRTQWGQHIGLIQMGEPQRKKYGYYRGMSEEDAVRASANYLVDNGFRPGMGLLDMYSTINAGRPGLYDRSDAANGGAPGTVRDKVEQQMGGHKAKAAALLGGDFFPTPTNVYTNDGIDAPANDLDVYEGHQKPYSPTLVEVTAQAQERPQAYETWGDQLYDSAAQNWYTAKLARWASQSQVDPNDMGWSAPEWEEITKTLPEQYHDYVLTGSSKINRDLRLKYAHEMYERDQRAGATGIVSSLTADLLTGAADPVLLPLVAASEGLAIPARMTQTFVRKVVGGALVGGTVNASLELGAKYGLEDPHTDAAMAFGVGALLGGLTGPLAANRATQVEAQHLAQTGLDGIARAKEASLAPLQHTIANQGGSAGATKNLTHRDSLIPEDWGIDDVDVDRGFGGKLRLDVAGQLTTSPNPRARIAGFSIFEESAGTKGHSVLDHSASVRASSIEKKFVGNLNSVYQPAMHEYVKEAGTGFYNVVGRARAAQEFKHAVEAYMRDPHPNPAANPHVARAATARKEFYDNFRSELERVGLGQNFVDKGYYSPKIADHFKIAELDRTIHHEDMEAFITEAIRRAHGEELDPKLLAKMAKGYWNNIRRAGYGIEDSISGALGLGDRDSFKKAFKSSLDDANILTDQELDSVFDVFSGVVDETKAKKQDGSKGVGYLKRRTVMDYAFKGKVRTRDGGSMDFSMDDLFIADSEFLDRRYARSMSGRIAFADTKIRDPKTGELIFDGIRTENDLNKLKNWVREGYRLMPGGHDQHKAAMDNAVENIDFGWKRINGIPVYGQEKSYAQWVRRAKVLQFIRLMSNMGLNQVQESWKIAAMTGFRAAASQLPSIRQMVNEAGRSVPKRDRLLGELQHMTGTGLDGLFGRLDFRFDDDRIGASTSSWLGNKIDTGLDWGQRMTAEVSLMRHIQDYQSKWAAKAISQHLLNMARQTKTEAGTFDLAKLTGKNKDRLATAGIGDEQAQLIFGNLLKHSEKDGKRLVSLGSNKWDPEAVTQFTYFVNRHIDRLVQRNDVGGLAKWMSNPLASMFVQFRSFVLGAWSKSTLYAVNHMDPRMAVLLLGELAAGTATYMVRSLDTLATEEGRDKWWDETMDPVNLLKNGYARTATSSILPMLADSAMMFTPVGPQFGSARASGSPTDALLGSPAVDQVSSMARFSRGAVDSVLDGREMAQSEIKAGVRAFLPLGNFLPFTAWISHMIEDRDKSPPRD